ncbi:DSBA oxidoreductase [Alcanivorax xiamenensis]|uniref:2-hydroxychromene-2-carboxylate isomerase n=1 Tax=Alcanivorax xiamenensis TaxID=1177156 RepID=A0ABQ6Y2V1_9GAMM|nr:2-hydroxychromene-2-carboxylate isomerase [Alcanivorax xiamenensis]KAF0802627.1 DSBA oxidoreductase [Alcanivorax xiamenensis]
MSKTVEFFFDVGSPASYLAWTQLPGIAERQGAELLYRPMLLGGVFKATGNASPAAVPLKGLYSRMDMQRYARRYGVTLNQNPHFPVNTLSCMRLLTAALNTPQWETLLKAVFEGMWLKERKLDELDVLGATLQEAGLDPAEWAARAQEPEVKEVLKQTTEEAVSRGIFGAPTMFVGDEMFFGQDRLDWVEEELSKS